MPNSNPLQGVLQWFQVQKQSPLFLPILVSIIISLFVFRWFAGGDRRKLPPSPPKLPIIGNFHQLGTLPHRNLRDLSNKYGPLMILNLGSASTLVVSSPEMAKEVTKTHDIVFANRPPTKGAKKLLYNCTDIGFAPYGEYWREVRKVCVTKLLSAKRVQFFDVARKEEIGSLIEKVKVLSSQPGTVVDLTELLLNLANNLISRVAFGKSYEEKDGTNRLGHLTRDVLTLLGAFSIRDLYPALGWIDGLSGLTRKMNKTHKEMDAFLDQVIEDHLNNKLGSSSDGHETIIDTLLRVQKDKTLSITLVRDNIKAIVMDLFIAGTDTISIVVEWAMVQLLMHPEMMKRAQEEVRRVVGNKSRVHEDDTHHMHYVKCVVKETLRLHPPVPLLVPRESSEDTNINGFHIPAKTRVFVNSWAIQRDPKSWESPEEFIPERFINNPVDYKGSNFEYLPFGSGRRGCPGIQFGLVASELLLANLLFWFDWEVPLDGSGKQILDMDEHFGLVVYKKNPTLIIPSLH
ncbi:cytochrome P450 71A1-like [Papaver somniferum]|uniref:cytochrome P450 71A1-like n=1 Tax=Papaver somniferum TaxID=3469 RepID=UPI000E701F9C|nr:cytochrome P450 71A1-like [Papaver somniferum]